MFRTACVWKKKLQHDNITVRNVYRCKQIQISFEEDCKLPGWLKSGTLNIANDYISSLTIVPYL